MDKPLLRCTVTIKIVLKYHSEIEKRVKNCTYIRKGTILRKFGEQEEGTLRYKLYLKTHSCKQLDDIISF
jgi:hypothetical protein